MSDACCKCRGNIHTAFLTGTVVDAQAIHPKTQRHFSFLLQKHHAESMWGINCNVKNPHVHIDTMHTYAHVYGGRRSGAEKLILFGAIVFMSVAV